MADRIEKTIHIKSSIARVWRAISDYKEYGTWFRCEINEPFVVGKTVSGRMTVEGFEHLTFPMEILKMEENRLFVCRWPAYVEKTDLDLLQEPWLLMEYHLKEVDGGTQLTIIETGFEKLNAAIQDEARRGNEGGWDYQLNNIRTYLHEQK